MLKRKSMSSLEFVNKGLHSFQELFFIKYFFGRLHQERDGQGMLSAWQGREICGVF